MIPQSIRVEFAGWRGRRDETIDAGAVEAAVRGHEDRAGDVLKSDHRSVVTSVPTQAGAMVVKEVRKGGFRRRLADRFRGTPARRAFTSGRRLQSLGIGTAEPVAYLEQGTRSLFVCRDLRDSPTADQALATNAATLDLLVDLLVALHRCGAIHGDLRAQHVHIVGDATARLIDLEALRFHTSLTDAQRIRDLAQLNASIADELADSKQRRDAFDRYARALPFRDSDDEVFRSVTAASIERRHLFRGA